MLQNNLLSQNKEIITTTKALQPKHCKPSLVACNYSKKKTA